MWEDVRRCEKMWRWGEDVRMRRCEDEKMWRWADVKMWRCEDEKMWRWEDVKMRRCEDERMWRWEDVKMRRCEDEKMWRWEGVKMRGCEDEKMWRWEDVKMRRCEDEKMWRWEDVKMRGCEDEKMWRWEDVKMRGCEDEKMWRWEDVKMRGCENEKMWRWEDVKMRRCFTDPHYWKNPALRRSREKEISGNILPKKLTMIAASLRNARDVVLKDWGQIYSIYSSSERTRNCSWQFVLWPTGYTQVDGSQEESLHPWEGSDWSAPGGNRIQIDACIFPSVPRLWWMDSLIKTSECQWIGSSWKWQRSEGCANLALLGGTGGCLVCWRRGEWFCAECVQAGPLTALLQPIVKTS